MSPFDSAQGDILARLLLKPYNVRWTGKTASRRLREFPVLRFTEKIFRLFSLVNLGTGKSAQKHRFALSFGYFSTRKSNM